MPKRVICICVYCIVRYRITQNINLPFRVIPHITQHGRSRVEIEIRVKVCTHTHTHTYTHAHTLVHTLAVSLHLPVPSHPRTHHRAYVQGQFSPKLFATNVVVSIPVPPNTAKVRLSSSTGKSRYNPDGDKIVWTYVLCVCVCVVCVCVLCFRVVLILCCVCVLCSSINKFPGNASYMMKGTVRLIASMRDKQWSRPPINMTFQVSVVVASVLHVCSAC